MTPEVWIGGWKVAPRPQDFAGWQPPQVRSFLADVTEYVRGDGNLICYLCDVLRARGMRLEVGERWPDNWVQKEVHGDTPRTKENT